MTYTINRYGNEEALVSWVRRLLDQGSKVQIVTHESSRLRLFFSAPDLKRITFLPVSS